MRWSREKTLMAAGLEAGLATTNMSRSMTNLFVSTSFNRCLSVAGAHAHECAIDSKSDPNFASVCPPLPPSPQIVPS